MEEIKLSKNFSIREAFKFGYICYKNNFSKFIGILILLMFTSVASIFLSFTAPETLTFNLFKVLDLIIAFVIIYKIIKIGLNYYNKTTEASSNIIKFLIARIWYQIKIICTCLLTLLYFIIPITIFLSFDINFLSKIFNKSPILPISSILLYSFIIIGILLLILALITIFYIISKYYFSGYYIIEKNSSIKEDIIFTKKLTKDIKLKLLVFLIPCYILNILFTIGIVTIIFLPFIGFAEVYVYKKLSEQLQESKIQETKVAD